MAAGRGNNLARIRVNFPRHRAVATMRCYVRRARLLDDSPAQKLGL